MNSPPTGSTQSWIIVATGALSPLIILPCPPYWPGPTLGKEEGEWDSPDKSGSVIAQ
jgi:hypothetical protein